MKQVIATVEAPPALGPYAQGIRAGETIYVSGQLPMDPKTRRLIDGDIAAQTEQVLTNVRAIVEEGGGTMDDIVRITIYLTNLDDFDEVNRIYTMFFPTIDNALTETLPPARTTLEVSRLPRDAQIEMDAIAVITPGYSGFDVY